MLKYILATTIIAAVVVGFWYARHDDGDRIVIVQARFNSGDPDADFARGMIPHHLAAIDMAKDVLKHGKNPDIRKRAIEIIAAQETEIAWLKEWLKKNAQ